MTSRSTPVASSGGSTDTTPVGSTVGIGPTYALAGICVLQRQPDSMRTAIRRPRLCGIAIAGRNSSGEEFAVRAPGDDDLSDKPRGFRWQHPSPSRIAGHEWLPGAARFCHQTVPSIDHVRVKWTEFVAKQQLSRLNLELTGYNRCRSRIPCNGR